MSALDAVHEAAENRQGAKVIEREADADLRDALKAARAAGHSWSELGNAAGMSKQGARWLVRREESKT